MSGRPPDCPSCRLLMSGHPCGHWWMNGVRQEPIRWWQWRRMAQRRAYLDIVQR